MFERMCFLSVFIVAADASGTESESQGHVCPVVSVN